MLKSPKAGTIRLQTIEHVLHKKINKADIMHDKIVDENVQNFSWEIIGKEFSDSIRRGKYLFQT